MLIRGLFAGKVKMALHPALIRLPRPLKGSNFVSTKRNNMKTKNITFLNPAKQTLLSVILLLNTGFCFGQGDVIKNIVEETREKNYAAAPALGNVEPTVFEVNLNIHRLMPVAKTRFAVDISYKMVLRMLRSKSSPINTPSYMPSISTYALLKQYADSTSLLGSLSFNHHSNGQDHPFYDSEGNVNFINGNFSTNYIQAGLIKQCNKNAEAKYYSVSFEQHVKSNKENKNNYGFSRFHIDYKSEKKDLSKIIRKLKANNFIQLTVNNTWIFGKMGRATTTDLNKRLITSVFLSYKPACVNGFSFFAQYYRGQDYYNINFVNNLSFVRFGVNIEPTSLYKSLKS